MKIIAIIPACSGSKGLPDKNIKELNGIPLCAYSIKAAKEVESIKEHYAKFGDRMPKALYDQLAALEARLNA